MKIFKFILPILFIISLTGCFKDDGNYDYNELVPFYVTTTPNASLISGEQKLYEGLIGIADDPDNEKGREFNFEWYIDNELVSTERNFLYKAGKQGQFFGMVKATEVGTGTSECYTFSIKVTSPYETGFMILSENDEGNASLHMIRSSIVSGNYYEGTNDTIIYKNEYMNVFEKENEEKLQGKPISILEHHAANDYDSELFGEITLITENAGKRTIQDLNGLTFERETYIDQEFSESGLPDNFNPKTEICSCWDNFILDENGLIYARRISDRGGYHLGTFDKEIPLYGGKHRFTDLLFCCYPRSDAFLALEEKTNEDGQTTRDYCGIYSQTYRPDRNQKFLPFGVNEEATDVSMDDFIDVKGEIVFSDYMKRRFWKPCMRHAVIYKTDEGDYILHCFDALVMGNVIEVEKSRKINLTQDYRITKVTGMQASKNDEYTLFISDESHVYEYVASRNEIKRFIDFSDSEVKISAIGLQTTENISGSYDGCENNLAVGYEDGHIEIYEIGKNYTDLRKNIFISKENYGKIKQIVYKIGRCTRFNNL